jgi:hypothetical protein
VTKGRQTAAKGSPIREQVIELRKQNLSIYDISRALQEKDRHLSPAAVARLLQEAGFASCRAAPMRSVPRASVLRRPRWPMCANWTWSAAVPHPVRRAVPVRSVAGAGPLERMLDRCGFPGTQQIPAAAAMRALLALKLFGSARHSHVMSSVFDEGLALFAGLNAIPKRSFLTSTAAASRRRPTRS